MSRFDVWTVYKETWLTSVLLQHSMCEVCVQVQLVEIHCSHLSPTGLLVGYVTISEMVIHCSLA